jgi:hypothetical protein
LQNFLDRIGHFLKISLDGTCALAGLNRPRQHQYARQDVADGHGGSPAATWPEQEKSRKTH